MCSFFQKWIKNANCHHVVTTHADCNKNVEKSLQPTHKIVQFPISNQMNNQRKLWQNWCSSSVIATLIKSTRYDFFFTKPSSSLNIHFSAVLSDVALLIAFFSFFLSSLVVVFVVNISISILTWCLRYMSIKISFCYAITYTDKCNTTCACNFMAEEQRICLAESKNFRNACINNLDHVS